MKEKLMTGDEAMALAEAMGLNNEVQDFVHFQFHETALCCDAPGDLELLTGVGGRLRLNRSSFEPIVMEDFMAIFHDTGCPNDFPRAAAAFFELDEEEG